MLQSLTKLLKTSILTLLLLNISYNSCLAKENDFAKLKEDSYKTLAEAFFNKDTYGNFRIEIVETLGKLADPTDNSYDDSDYKQNLVDRTLKTIITAVAEKLKNTKKPIFKVEQDLNIEDKANEIAKKGDAAIAYMLSDALYDSNYSIQLYASTSLTKIKDKSTYPLFVNMLDSDNKQHVLIALAALRNIDNPDVAHKLIKLAEDESQMSKIRLRAMNTLEALAPEKAINVALKNINSSDKDLKINSIVFLASENNIEGILAFKDLLKDQATYKTTLTLLPGVVDSLQENSIDLLREFYNRDDFTYKLSTLRAMTKLKNKEPVFDLIMDAYNNDTVDFKIMAYRLLTDMGTDTSIDLLSKVTFKEPENFIQAASYLIATKDKRFDPVLIQYLPQNNESLQLLISSYFLLQKSNTEIAKDTLLKLLKSDKEVIQYQAALVLTENGFDEGLDVVKSLLDSQNSNLKAKAVIVLSKRKDKAIVPYLVDAIKNNQNPQKAYGAALLLYNLGDDQYLDLLVRYLSRKDIDAINDVFMNKQLFKDLLTNQNEWVRINSASTLLSTGDQSALKEVRELFNNNDVQIRSRAIQLIGEYGTTEDISLLQGLINDEYVRIRVNASEAILRIIHREENKLGS